jgi:phenylacetate-CoA ligase
MRPGKLARRWGAPLRLIGGTIGLLRSQWWSNEKIAAYQRARLIDMLRHSVERVPFYADLGLAAADIASSDDLQRFPVIRKHDVQRQTERFLARGVDKSELHVSTSSGTTGEPAVTYFDDESWLLVKFALKARRVLSDVRSPRQRVLIMSASHGHAWSSAPRFGLVSVAYMSLADPDPVEQNLAELLRLKPTIVYGFPSYLLALADAAKSQKIDLPRVPVIYTSSEVLSPAARAALGRAYGGRVIDVYGSSEFKEIAVQCKHNSYHINFESVYVETVKEHDDAPARLLVTSLVNKAMPLIRYELGDAAETVAARCPCGRSSMQLIRVQGRLAEMLEFPDGTRVSPYVLEDVIENDPAVRYFKIAHESPWSLRIEILADAADPDAYRRNIELRLRERLPAQASLRFVALTERPRPVKRRAVSREF